MQTYQRSVALTREKHPMLGGATANISPCAFWPTKPVEPQVKITDQGPADILIAQNLRDPITTLKGARELRKAFGERARIVTADQGGHLSYLFLDNTCLNNTVTQFLATGHRPAQDIACAAEPS